MKLFTATCEFKFIVVAKDKKDAERVAQRNVNRAYRDQLSDEFFWTAKEGIYVENWDEDDVPYGAQDGKTIGKYMREET